VNHAARLPALQAALLSEREEAKLAVALEKQALEEARNARVRVGPHCRQLLGLHCGGRTQPHCGRRTPATHCTRCYSAHLATRELNTRSA
jgi:hypothetical protein